MRNITLNIKQLLFISNSNIISQWKKYTRVYKIPYINDNNLYNYVHTLDIKMQFYTQ